MHITTARSEQPVQKPSTAVIRSPFRYNTAMSAATPGPAAPPEIRQATRTTDGSGGVIEGALLTPAQAEARRQAGLDIVVTGDDAVANRLLAADIESTAGPWMHHYPNLATTGPKALPHFQQRRKPPAGHSFYETASHQALGAP